jgi:hypothetical protein
MERKHTIAGAPEVRVAVRVRGVSSEQRYFDERTCTTRLTPDFVVIRLRDQVDLDCELHITNMRTQMGGTYRVAWINTLAELGFYPVGLELLDPDGENRERDSIPEGVETEDAAPVALLECVGCYQRVSTPLPEAETASLGEGFTIARHCDICKATTGWVYCVENPRVAETPSEDEPTRQEELSPAAGRPAPAESSAQKTAGPSKDHRLKGRAPIRMMVKINRTKYGLPVVDICETINISRTGLYFTTKQGYEVGEILEVISPYHPDSMAIPVQARVVRRDEFPGNCQKGVAIRFTPAFALPSPPA